MTRDDARLYTDRSWLRDVQYRTDTNLAARQSIYAYQHPQLDLPAVVLGLAGLHGSETVADVGCGNGAYLAELAWTCPSACSAQPAGAYREPGWPSPTPLPCRCAMAPLT